VLHDLTIAAMYFRRIVFLRDGALAGDGPPADVLTESTLREIFETDVRVRVDEDGLPLVRPRRRP